MRKQIRRGVFETNSSSCHSVSIQNGDWVENPYESIRVNPEDNKVHVEFGEFGWGYNRYTDPYVKLQYALTMVMETERPKTIDDIYNLAGYIEINDLIMEKLKCDGICIDSEMKNDTWNKHRYVDIDGYIDHQSYEDYSSLKDFLYDNNITLEEFIFNTKYILIIDNDNH